MSGPKYHHFDCDLRMKIHAYSRYQLNQISKAVMADFQMLLNERQNLEKSKEHLFSQLKKKRDNVRQRIESFPLENPKEIQMKEEALQSLETLTEFPKMLLSSSIEETSRYFEEPLALANARTKVAQKMKDLKNYTFLLEEKADQIQNDFEEAMKNSEKKKEKTNTFLAIKSLESVASTIDFSKIQFGSHEKKSFDEADCDEIQSGLADIDFIYSLSHLSLTNFEEAKKIKEGLITLTNETEPFPIRRNMKDKLLKELSYLREQSKSEEALFLEMEFEFNDLVSHLSIDPMLYGKRRNYLEMKEALYNLTRDIEEVYKPKMIGETIFEVMNDLGYPLLKMDSLEGTELYEYDYNSAVSIYKGEKGMVMMELVSQTDCSNDQEKTLFLDKMENFCLKYHDIIQELEKRGIQVIKDGEMPVSKEFIRSIQTDSSDNCNKKKVKERKEESMHNEIL